MKQFRQRVCNNVRDIPEMLKVFPFIIYLFVSSWFRPSEDGLSEDDRRWLAFVELEQPELYKAAVRVAQGRGDYTAKGIADALRQLLS